MPIAIRAALAAGLVTLAASSAASAAVYSSQSAFAANVASGAYTEDYTGIPNGNQGFRAFESNGYGYTVTATTNSVAGHAGTISTSAGSASLVLTFDGAKAVTAVGGNFYATDPDFNPAAATVTITLADGTQEQFASTGAADFRGFTSDAPIASLTFAAGFGNDDFFPTLDNLTVGAAAVPEPTTLATLGLLAIAARRRRAGR